MDEQQQPGLTGSEQELNKLFKELLDGCRDDLEEAKINVEQFLEEVVSNGSMGKERFGNFYNDALRIKGDARDRQLKLLNMFKDRVSTKEKIELTKAEQNDNIGALPSTQEMSQYIEEMEKARKSMEPSKITMTSLDDEMKNQEDIKNSYKNDYSEEDLDDLEEYEIDPYGDEDDDEQ